MLVPERKFSSSNIVTSLAAFVRLEYENAKDNKESSGVNKKLTSSQNAYNGIYDAEIQQAINNQGGSNVYRRLTASKVDSLQSWLNEILSEKYWHMTPTPIPELSDKLKNEIIYHAAKTGMQILSNQPQTPEIIEEAKETTYRTVDILQQEFLDKIRKEASIRCDKMQTEMEDQLIDGDFDTILSNFILYYGIYQTAFLKGPIVRIKRVIKYDENGKSIVREKPCLCWYCPSPMDMYFSADTTNIYEGELFESVIYSRDELSLMKQLPNYNKEAIDRVLRKKQYSTSSDIDTDDYIKQERREIENRNNTTILNSNMFKGVEMYGAVAGYLLKQWGLNSIEDENASYEANIIMIEDEIIMATLNEDPLNRRPYYSASYKPIPNSIWGMSLPESMSDVQRMCNGAVRAMADNMSLASGPMVAYDLAQLPPEEDVTSLYPWKVFTFDGSRGYNTRKAVEFFQPNNNVEQLVSVYMNWKSEADNVTNIPSFSLGNTNVSGAGRALADYEKVLTPDGAIKISSLSVGDKILNTYGSQSNVLSVYPQGNRDIYRITFSNGEYVDCDYEHRWSVSTNTKIGFITLTTKELLKKGLYRKTIFGREKPRWALPNIEYIDYPKKQVAIDPYTMGLLLGNGDSRCRLTSEDNEIFDRIPYQLGNIVKNKYKKVITRCICGVRGEYHKYGLNCESIYKFIPSDYLYNSIEIRLELLRGLMDIKGCCSEIGDIVFLSVYSEKFKDDFVRLVKSLGATSVFVKKEKTEYRIKFNLDNEIIFKSEQKQKRILNRKKEHIYITDIEYIGEYNATCITVDSKDNLYICDNYIPTHNTASGLSILQSNLTKGIKDHVLNISRNILQPALKKLFDWNMLYNPDESIKGDANIVLIGPLKVVTKEQKQIRMAELLNITNNPTDLQILGLPGRTNLLREVFKINDVDSTDIIPNKDELKQQEEIPSNQQQIPMQEQ